MRKVYIVIIIFHTSALNSQSNLEDLISVFDTNCGWRVNFKNDSLININNNNIYYFFHKGSKGGLDQYDPKLSKCKKHNNKIQNSIEFTIKILGNITNADMDSIRNFNQKQKETALKKKKTDESYLNNFRTYTPNYEMYKLTFLVEPIYLPEFDVHFTIESNIEHNNAYILSTKQKYINFKEEIINKIITHQKECIQLLPKSEIKPKEKRR